jgi:ferredoxin
MTLDQNNRVYLLELKKERSCMVRRLKKASRGASFTINVDGDSVPAFYGETIATAILSAGKRILSKSTRNQYPRSVYCGMGICNECLVTLEDGSRVRACQTLAVPMMKIKTG